MLGITCWAWDGFKIASRSCFWSELDYSWVLALSWFGLFSILWKEVLFDLSISGLCLIHFNSQTGLFQIDTTINETLSSRYKLWITLLQIWAVNRLGKLRLVTFTHGQNLNMYWSSWHSVIWWTASSKNYIKHYLLEQAIIKL